MNLKRKHLQVKISSEINTCVKMLYAPVKDKANGNKGFAGNVHLYNPVTSYRGVKPFLTQDIYKGSRLLSAL